MLKLFKSRSFAAGCLLAALFARTPLIAADVSSKEISILPADHWQIVAAQDDRVTLAERDNCLAIKFDLAINGIHQQGNWTYNQKTFDLRLRQPVALDPSVDRIAFEAIGHEFKTWNTRDEVVQLWPLIQDQSGEILAYIPQKYATLAPKETTWARWMTCNFFCGEAGGATHEIYEAEGGDGNARPDGKLNFIGFRVVVRKMKTGQKDGQLVLGSIQPIPGHFAFENPFLYASSVLNKKGRYRLAVEAAQEFQGLPVVMKQQDVDFDPDNLQRARQRLSLPLPANGDYWIKYQIADAQSGQLVKEETLRHRVFDHPATQEKLTQDDGTHTPLLGNIRFNPQRGGNGVYRADEPITATIRVFPKQSPSLSVSWELLQYAYNTVIDQGQASLQFQNNAPQDFTLTPRTLPGRDAYRLRITVNDGSKTIDRQEFVLGRQTDFSKPYANRTGVFTNREQLKKQSYYRCTYITISTDLPKTEDDAAQRFARVLDEAGSLTRHWTYCVDVAAIEILPGVYDFALLDRLMDIAADRGIELTIRVGHIDAEYPFRWVRFSRQHNFDGREIDEHFYGGFALTDKQYLETWHRLNKALFDRYQRHPAFQGYYLLQPAGECTIEDKPWEGVVAGYEQPSQQAFRDYLKNKLGLSLAQLNARWGTHYADWSEVLPPQPAFNLGKTPDLRMAWVDFCTFKFWLDDMGWFSTAAARIREYDKDRVVITYGGYEDPAIMGNVDYMHNGGNHYLKNEGKFVDFWKLGRTGLISEPHHPHRWAAYGDLAERGWVLDWTLWVMIAQASGGGANLHLYYDPRPKNLQAHFGGSMAYDRFAKYRPILDELQSVDLLPPPVQTATTHSRLTLICKHRTTFSPRMDDLERWFELLKFASVPAEPFRADHAASYKLLLPNVLDEVMSETEIDRIVAQVRDQGSKTLITAITGKYCPEHPNEQWVLLRKLGISPPQGAYVQSDAGVKATVAAENPLYAAGSKVDFFTLAQLQKDLQGDDIKKQFAMYPYRWIPQTDYFGYFRDNKDIAGDIWARFDSGGVAISHHKLGKGEVVVYWGIPDYRLSSAGDLMTKATAWAGIENPRRGNPIPLMLEARAASTGRFYSLLYHETPGRYTQRLPAVTDGQWFVDDLVADQKFGVYTGRELREKGITIDYAEGASPLKVLRLIPRDNMSADWVKKYRQP